MSTTTDNRSIYANRDREVAEVRAEVLRRAEQQAVKPITSVDDLAGDPEMTADFDVDKILRQVRKDRNLHSSR